ncbi:MAG: radical SAM protein [Candidatus Omnitrophica bacterium]|nr:radical SAM protein [Candidatus Omnitrophota bacterium]MDD5042889.1 radical SAM protein [Candidatus Omnitrophota bacterium]MDD5501276.1 radical SAM protein [Candidatus Omnitrophota bacterium]
MKYIYGPIKSRRLGLSLGLSLSLRKVCNFDCIYCQWGRTSSQVSERKEYVAAAEIIAELKSWLLEYPVEAKKLNFVTLSGFGEPTLNTCIGEVIESAREATGAKVAVITNSTLLGSPEVRKSILSADLIVPSLDAVDEEIFKKIDRPCSGVELDSILEGLVALRKEFNGQIWLEIMLLSGINDDIKHIEDLVKWVKLINPDKVQLNSPVRSTAESGVLPVDKKRLAEIRGMLGDKAEII